LNLGPINKHISPHLTSPTKKASQHTLSLSHYSTLPPLSGKPAMADGRGGVGGQPPSSVAAAAVVARRCGCGLGRLVRRLRRQAALCAARPAPASSRLRGGRCQYDPLSYARNFDRGGVDVAGGLDDDSDAAQLYYSYTFSSRFVLPAAAAAAARAHPSSLAAGRTAPATATH
ncbi:Os02g0170701, partial [Oryza sativa Japonica Group]